jgi:hypothetical protein
VNNTSSADAFGNHPGRGFDLFSLRSHFAKQFLEAIEVALVPLAHAVKSSHINRSYAPMQRRNAR